MPRPFTELVGKYAGKQICVMGGAPTLAEHLTQVQADVYISANHHGIKLRAADFVLCMDDHVNEAGGRPMQGFIRQWSDAPIIATDGWADYQLTDWPHAPRRLLSGKVAIWAAFAMGARSVVVAGMDGYGGTKNSLMVARMVADHITAPVRIVGGGPLTEVWPLYDHAEKFPRYKEAPALKLMKSEDGFSTFEFIKPTAYQGMQRSKGDRIRGTRMTFFKLLKSKMVKEVEA